MFLLCSYKTSVSLFVCLSVCLCVCLSTRINRKHMSKFHQLFSVHVIWSCGQLGPSLTAIQYVICLRFWCCEFPASSQSVPHDGRCHAGSGHIFVSSLLWCGRAWNVRHRRTWAGRPPKLPVLWLKPPLGRSEPVLLFGELNEVTWYGPFAENGFPSLVASLFCFPTS